MHYLDTLLLTAKDCVCVVLHGDNQYVLWKQQFLSFHYRDGRMLFDYLAEKHGVSVLIALSVGTQV